MSNNPDGLVSFYIFPMTKKPKDFAVVGNSVSVYYYYRDGLNITTTSYDHDWFEGRFSDGDAEDMASGRLVFLGWAPKGECGASKLLKEKNIAKAQEQELLNKLGLMAQVNIKTIPLKKRKIRGVEE